MDLGDLGLLAEVSWTITCCVPERIVCGCVHVPQLLLKPVIFVSDLGE